MSLHHLAAMTLAAAAVEGIDHQIDSSTGKRKKLSGDERLRRNRERNRMHARKTRERKKLQSQVLQTRINELHAEGNRLRLMVDERYTASVLLGMTQTIEDSAGERIPIKSSATICQNAYAVAMAENSLFGDHATATAAGSSPQEPKRVRRRGKYSPQERERLRRERNRMHAKRTRDRKKMLVEISEQMITKMENEARCLRDYLVSVKLMSVEESRVSEERMVASQKELAQLKASQTEYDAEDGEEDEEEERSSDYDDGDGDDEHDGSVSDSDDNEKAWGGSYDGSSNHDSISGETSGDNTTSTGSHVSGLPSAPSSSGSGSGSGSASSGSNSDSRGGRDNSSGCNSSGSGGDSPIPKHEKSSDGSGNERESADADADADWNSKGDDEEACPPAPVSRPKSSASKKRSSVLPADSIGASASASRIHPTTGILDATAAAIWTVSKKAKYHHLHAAPLQSVESYRHGATSLDGTTAATATAPLHATASATVSSSATATATAPVQKRSDLHLGVDALEHAAFLVQTLQQTSLLTADGRGMGLGTVPDVAPRPPSVSSIISTTEVSDSLAASVSTNSRGFQSIASSISSSSRTNGRDGASTSASASVATTSASSSTQSGVISTQEVTATLAAVAAADYMSDTAHTFYSVKDSSSWASSSMTARGVASSAAVVPVGPGPVPVVCPVPMVLLDTRVVPKIVLAVIPTLAPAPAEGGLSPRGILSPHGTDESAAAEARVSTCELGESGGPTEEGVIPPI